MSVWFLVLHENGSAIPVSWELAGQARKLADALKTNVQSVILGQDVDELARDSFEYGSDEAIVVESQTLKRYRNEPYYKVVAELAKKYKPSVLLVGATYQGRDLAGSVAAYLKTGLTADCTELGIESQKKILEQIRPAYDGSVLAVIWCRNCVTQMATVRPDNFPIPEKKPGKTGRIIHEKAFLSEDEIATKVIGIIRQPVDETILLKDADIVIGAGRGLSNKRNFDLLNKLASILGASVGASQGAINMGWIDRKFLIGQTGITIRPKLYIAIGISGAIQHTLGIKDSKIIVAIDKNPDAPIFKSADFGIVGDVSILLPLLIQEARERLGGVRKVA